MGFCHCTRCQRWSGGPGMAEVEVEATNFKVTAGQELMKHVQRGRVLVGLASAANCGSSLYAGGGDKLLRGRREPCRTSSSSPRTT